MSRRDIIYNLDPLPFNTLRRLKVTVIGGSYRRWDGFIEAGLKPHLPALLIMAGKSLELQKELDEAKRVLTAIRDHGTTISAVDLAAEFLARPEIEDKLTAAKGDPESDSYQYDYTQ